MERKVSKITLMSLVVLIMLVSCTFSFQSHVTVRVKGGIADNADEETSVYIYGFLDEEKRDAAYEELVALSHDSTLKSGEFESFLYDYLPSGNEDVRIAGYVSGNGIGSTANGTMATLTIRWGTMSPYVGEDYDRTMLYLLAAGESDGQRYIGIKKAQIQSGSYSTEIILKNAAEISLDETI